MVVDAAPTTGACGLVASQPCVPAPLTRVLAFQAANQEEEPDPSQPWPQSCMRTGGTAARDFENGVPGIYSPGCVPGKPDACSNEDHLAKLHIKEVVGVDPGA